MGKADVLTKQYMQDAAVFADAFNLLLYDGKQIIRPEQLHAIDTAEMASLYGDSKESAQIQVYRDVLKYVTAMEDGKLAYLILGIENQSKIHYAMPVRNMLYDALQYNSQIREAAKKHRKGKKAEALTNDEYLSGFTLRDKLLPVITLVVYFGSKPWDAPRSLFDMLSVEDADILSYVADYKLNLLEPLAMSDGDIAKLKTDLKNVFYYIKYSRDKEKLCEIVNRDESFRELRRGTVEMLNEVTNSKLRISEKEETVDMCKAIEDIRNDGRAEGRVEGRAEGRILGGLSMLCELVCDGLLTVAQAAAKAKVSEEQFRKQMEDAGYSRA
ncbi:MAG: Rpn family recombination-promoting nuclease/putative transposase [Eubacteriales bacterium]|nr:Rpn family recombination-promoting nuclease/putative transposase [Eubacteriales bacterium]